MQGAPLFAVSFAPERQMDSFPVDVEVDIDPEQVVRWLMVERERGGSGLEITAWRQNESRPVAPVTDDKLGDEEREDLSADATIARLEVTPTHEDWRLVISVETELEPVVPEEDAGEDEGEPVDLDTFYLDFLRSPRSTVSIAAEAESVEGKAHLEQLIRAIETNSHVPQGLV
jgi:hypothetical protein